MKKLTIGFFVLVFMIVGIGMGINAYAHDDDRMECVQKVKMLQAFNYDATEEDKRREIEMTCFGGGEPNVSATVNGKNYRCVPMAEYRNYGIWKEVGGKTK